MQTPGTVRQLDYALPQPWHRRHRRAITLATLAFTCAALLLFVIPIAWRNSVLWYWQGRCISFEPAADWVVAMDSSRIAQPWSTFYSRLSPPGFVSDGTVFLGTRRSRSSTRYLVAVDVRWGAAGATLGVRTIELGSLVKPPREQLALSDSPVLPHDARIRFGHPDPQDPTHFTITWQLGDRTQTLDGWLLDAAEPGLAPRVKLEERTRSVPQPATSPAAQ